MARGGGFRGVVTAAACAALLALSAPARADHEQEAIVDAVILAALPALGGQALLVPRETTRYRLLLAWPFSVPLDAEMLARDPVHHRLLLEPQLLIGDGAALRGRLGYRFVDGYWFAGLGAAWLDARGHEDAPGLSPELGARIPFDSDPAKLSNVPNVFFALRADTPSDRAFGHVWAPSLSVGLGLY